MSWQPEAVVISGYRVPREIWNEVFEFCDTHWQTDPDIPEDWEDMFIDMDQPGGDNHETFFGVILYNISDNDHTREFDTILANYETVEKVQDAFHKLFRHVYTVKGFPYPSYNKYIGVRWI